ncbi:L-glutamine:D-fructose-6-phosphate aminotransferase [Campylobacter ureolyticus RIGS 9880]|uniref:Glutamine--fructose-6-phosphate aminotransferase [isomerizing] n=1 Tax=Campylobacter ureolyticus RIGS 9880 TaxID=1032069 RepID=A0AAU8U3L3_9BACT|nr:glutamine--fructose-6-phosphate transaminase (isomerizing) [Campylobacter ureolyticus]AKT90901.1 L-glutamine:D-fructose-6-phosphate aminotransferase [Campylobacter ureolyticus RIGS 9880]MCR8699566.1 glutamine--fructose-6-phosphate transaminase (isomerizing) [Campylobacter ureolyticus]MCZ6110750.1 glutamine--fructose-6-phosphate transaminase (isomerizing) [Campylobacter ureolyticus]MCZ6155889.1 glutamine--fructose-6-phosphate transaminase (isomerizing) [Campylobacter ureolyticus]MDU7071361.1
MCGIVGYIGQKEKKNIILNGLKELEYRGYDSSGMAIMDENGKIDCFKAVGKIKNLEEKTKNFSSIGQGIAIGHTRWATHGKPTEINAHPHFGEYSFVIHNGIIENYKELKDELEKDGIKFLSQTDTEVIVKLFEKINQKESDPFKAFKKTISRLIGAYAILLITKKANGKIFFAKNAVPLIVGKNDDGEIFFSSSDSPLIGFLKDVAYLDDNTYGVAKFSDIKFFKDENEINPSKKTLPSDRSFAQKEGFRFFMEKEIYEQSVVATETLMGRIKNNQIYLEELDKELFNNIDEIIMCACGTSYHAAITASYLFERVAQIRTKVEVASEFRYKDPVLRKNSLFIVISQSGETADTLEALKIAKDAGLKTLAICNVDNSSIVRLADNTLLTRAGIEKGVASTKAFSTQVITLWLVVLYLANLNKTISQNEFEKELKTLLKIPKILEVPSDLQEKLHRLSKHYLHGHGFFFIGRDVFYPLALEGALKLKEISYLHAEGYASGEMKHGPIALVDEKLYTIALMPENMLYEKTRSNVEEIVARDGFVFALSPKEFDLSDDFIKTSKQDHYMSEFFEMLVILQIFALEVAIRLGNDVDMPRNLAKSVTVE